MKTYILDASALLAFLQKGPGAHKINELLKDAVRGHVEIVMSAVNHGEVYGGLLRQHGPDRARATMNAVHPLPIKIEDATPPRAFHAAEVKDKYKLYYVDSFAAALAIELRGTLVTSDSDFRRLGRNFPIVWLKA